jgi:hypothetical protein
MTTMLDTIRLVVAAPATGKMQRRKRSRAFFASKLALIVACAALLLGVVDARGQTLRVHGRVEWRDSLGLHPARQVRVVVVNAVNGKAHDTITDDRGEYTVSMTGQVTKVSVRVHSSSRAAMVRDSLTRVPYVQGADRTVPAGTQQIRVDLQTRAGSELGRALSIIDAMTYGRDHVSVNTGHQLPTADVIFPSRSSMYLGGARPSEPCARHMPPAKQSAHADSMCTILVSDHDHSDWDVVLHEYGHMVARYLALNGSLKGALKHGFDYCFAGGYSKPPERRFEVAWTEGWPTYFSFAVQHELGSRGRPGDAVYVDSRPNNTKTIHFPLDTVTERYRSLGEDNEATVARILFDLVSVRGNAEKENIGLGAAGLWTLLHKERPTSLRGLWSAVLAGRSLEDSVLVSRIFTRHGIGPASVALARDLALGQMPPVFKWQWAPGACTWKGSSYQLLFRDAEWRVIGVSDVFSTMDFQLSPDLWRKVQSSKPPIRWMLFGSDSEIGLKSSPYLLITREF